MRISQGIRKGRAAAVAALATAAVLAGGLTTPAAADSTCNFTRTLCMWEGTSYTGQRFTVQALNPSVGACVDLVAHGWGNGRAHSAKNTATTAARLWTNTNCTGSSMPIPPGSISSFTFNAGSVFVY